MRLLLRGAGVLVLAALLFALAVLGEAHWEMRGLVPTLPDAAAIASLTRAPDAPIRVGYVNTAAQHTAGRGTIVHPAFVLEWSDGRLFVIDTGMERERALAFGQPFELLLGADPIEPLGSVGEQLGAAAQRVAGVAFTHLHSDHTGGLVSLCQEPERAPPVLQTPWQADLGNYMTRTGRNDIARSRCSPVRLPGGPLHQVSGFPGLVAIAAGGHTPGSSVYVAQVGGTNWVFSGDVTNSRQSLLENRPKQRVYSLLIVPEAPAQLELLRLWLAALDADPGFEVVVSHDGEALAASGLTAWSAAR